MFQIIIHDTPLTIMADSGASVNVLDERLPSVDQAPCASANKSENPWQSLENSPLF